MGPLWVDLGSFEVESEERELLAHPSVGGVILFSRNYYNSDQLSELTRQIRQAANKNIIIGVDQEGGRVQRFRDGFTQIPPAQSYALLPEGKQVANYAGWLMSSELIAHDIDLSFAPVLDKGFNCKAILSRAFGDSVEIILEYSSAFMRGMKKAGMATTGKHFPGHGDVLEDSHVTSPVDPRISVIEHDMSIFKSHIQHGLLDAMMPAHVIYPHYDPKPASASAFWLKKVLRQELGFNGVIFSDDLNMKGAHILGCPSERCNKALAAGCDMLLLCNDREATIEVIDNLEITKCDKAMNLLKKTHIDKKALYQSSKWKSHSENIKRFNEAWHKISYSE